MLKFTTGTTYYHNLSDNNTICYDDLIQYIVIKRNAKTVWIREQFTETAERKAVYTDKYAGEYIKPIPRKRSLFARDSFI